MLAQLDEDATILLQHLQGSVGASLVAIFQDSRLQLGVLDFFLLVESCSVTAIVSAKIGLRRALLRRRGLSYSLMHTASAAATRPARSAAS